MALNYSTYVSEIAAITAITSNILVNGDGTFAGPIPGAIDYAEQRIYREADLLVTYVTDTSTNLIANFRNFQYPTTAGIYKVIDQINVITPITAFASNGTRVPLQVASQQFIYSVYPSNSSGTGVPKFFCPTMDDYAILGPVPDQNYNVEIIGTQHPLPLSAANSSTFLTQSLPDLFIAASMIFMSGYMRNFGSQADNPQMSMSWDTQYKELFVSANLEEARKKYTAPAWQAQTPNQASPPRV